MKWQMMEIIIENDVWCMHKHTPSFASMDRVNMSHTVPVSVTKKVTQTSSSL